MKGVCKLMHFLPHNAVFNQGQVVVNMGIWYEYSKKVKELKKTTCCKKS
jgi:hypothetical protein